MALDTRTLIRRASDRATERLLREALGLPLATEEPEIRALTEEALKAAERLVFAAQLGVKDEQPYFTFYDPNDGYELKVAFLKWDDLQILVWTPRTDKERVYAGDAREFEREDERFSKPLKMPPRGGGGIAPSLGGRSGLTGREPRMGGKG